MYTKEPTMLDILDFCNISANNLDVYTRKEFREYVKREHGKKFLAKLNEAFKLGYIKRLRWHGYDLSDEGSREFIRLQRER